MKRRRKYLAIWILLTYVFIVIICWGKIGFESNFKYFVYTMAVAGIFLVSPFIKWASSDKFYNKLELNIDKIFLFYKFDIFTWVLFLMTIIYIIFSVPVLWDVFVSKDTLTHDGIVIEKNTQYFKVRANYSIHVMANNKTAKYDIPWDIYNSLKLKDHVTVNISSKFHKLKDISLETKEGRILSSWLYHAIHNTFWLVTVILFSFPYYFAGGGYERLTGYSIILLIALMICLYFQISNYSSIGKLANYRLKLTAALPET